MNNKIKLLEMNLEQSIWFKCMLIVAFFGPVVVFHKHHYRSNFCSDESMHVLF